MADRARFQGILLPNFKKKKLKINKNGIKYRTVEVEIEYPDGSKDIIKAKLFEQFRIFFNLKDNEIIDIAITVGGKNDGKGVVFIDKRKRVIAKRTHFGIETDLNVDSNLEREYKQILSQKDEIILEFLSRNYEQINWKRISLENINWSENLIKNFLNNWDWSGLSKNESLPWSIELIEKFGDKWDWERFSLNESLPWSEEFIDKHFDKWNWYYLSQIRNLPWSENFVDKYSEHINWTTLSRNENFPWSIKILHKYSEKFQSSENIWNTLKPYVDDEMVIELLEEIKNKENGRN